MLVILKRSPQYWLLLAVSILFYGGVKGQACTATERVYASTQTSSARIGITILFANVTLAEVQNKNDAVDNDVNSFATIYTNVGLLTLGTAWQTLRFADASLPAGNNANVPVSVKLGIGSTVLNVLNSIKLQATFNGAPVGTAYSGTSLLGLLGGQGESIATFTPGAQYNGVRVLIDPVVDIGTSVDLYAAYFHKESTGSQTCSIPTDVLTGCTSGLLGALNGVTDPLYVKDGSLGTHAEVRQNVGALGYVYLSALFPAASVAGDSVSITMSVPGSSLLDASVFTKLTVVAHLGNNVVATMPADASLLKIRLLDETNHIYRFTYAVNSSFDRISIRAGGLVNALTSVNVYEINRIIPKPPVMIDAAILASKTICFGENSTLSINNVQACTTYNWYNAAVGGSSVFTGTSFPRNALPAGTYNYFVEAVRDGCIDAKSERTPVTVIVKPRTQASDIDAPGITICMGLSTTLTATCNNVTILNPSFKWYNNAALTGTPISSTANLNISPTTTTSYWVTVEGTATCQSAPTSAKQVTVTVTPHPPPQITITSN